MVDLRPREMTRNPAARPRPARARRHRQLKGLAGIAAVAVIVAGTVAFYEQVFAPGVPATVLSDSSGLLMSPGASVTLYGADVGHVTSITEDGDGARLGISIDPDEVSSIPANVQASIQAPTVFGPKFLSLDVPGHPAARRIHADDVIEPTTVPTEINTVFSNLASVLNGIDPAKLSATLGAMSTTLDGRGGQLGSFLVQLDTYLREFHPNAPALSADLTTAPGVLKTYAAAAPDLIKTLGNLKTTSGTLVSQQAQFDAFLLNLTNFSGQATTFLDDNGSELERTLKTLLPVTGLLNDYSPEFGCLLASTKEVTTLKTVSMNASLGPGLEPYTAADKPKVEASSAPSCYGGPLTSATAADWTLHTFADGAGSYSGSPSLTTGDTPLAVQLFGSGGAAAASKASKSATPGKGK